MAPHATSLDFSRTPSSQSSSSDSRKDDICPPMESPYLRPTPSHELHDLVCIGFGPASLAVAIALHDSYAHSTRPTIGEPLPKVTFLERQPEFAWHAGMQIPGARMQISFLKDFATLRNPRSEFTFLNYLHRNNRLVQFSNVGTFTPRRLEYEDYMRWCSKHFDQVVSYGQEVISVVPESISMSGTNKTFTVYSKDIRTGQTTHVRTKHVLVAVGGRPKIPLGLEACGPRVIHSSQYQAFLRSTTLDLSAPLRIAVIGGGQSAAEIFSDLPSKFPASKSALLIKGTALRPSDDSPFVNEIFDPDRTDLVFQTPSRLRNQNLVADKATNYGVVRIELLEQLYDDLYTQRITHGNDESNWPRRIFANTSIATVIFNRPGSASPPFILCLQSNDQHQTDSKLPCDLIFVASGYERDMHKHLLEPCKPLLPFGQDEFEVARDYSVRFAAGKVASDAGVWLQGCNEKTHGLSDTLLSVLSIRGGEIVKSIFGR